MIVDPPVRLCCGQSHFGPVCPDGRVQCCLCFERVEQDKLNVTASGQKEDVCLKCAQKETTPPVWTEVKKDRWRRTDGAVVKWEIDSPHPNPCNPNCRLWTCWEPDPSEKRVLKKVGRERRAEDGHLWRLSAPRRFKTAQNAMLWMDKNYPLNKT